MPPSSDAALVLASQLRSLTDPSLAGLLVARGVHATGIRDFFDLADALLDPTSIQQVLGRLDRPALTTLAALAELGTATRVDAAAHLTARGADTAEHGPHLARALALALVTEQGGLFSVPPAVAEQLASWPELGLPSLDELIAEPAPATLSPVSQVDTRFTDRVSSEHAFATTAAVAELVSELQHESARELARGGVALPDSKRLAASMGVDIERVPELLEIAERAGLIALDAGRWLPTGSSQDWLADTSGERWSLLAAAWLERLPADVRTILGERAGGTWGDRLEEYVSWLFPAGGDWMRERMAVYIRDAELLGITADNVPSTPGVALLVDGPAAAADAMTGLFPAEVEQVYLQHDLSIVSPGPLAARLDARLRTMADAEGRALASTYRVSTASLNRAMAAGETATTIREFLGGISLTGIPQPLDYLVTEAATRYGLVRVGSSARGSYVRSTDAALLRTLLVDHGLSPLSLTRAGDRLESRFELGLVFWSLAEARYPVAAENASGEIIVLQRPRAARRDLAPATDPTKNLIEKLRLGSPVDDDSSDKAWLSRQLDVAIRGKLALTVTVQLPDGGTIDYQLEPASVAGGRLRARDRKADIERTLPLGSIVAVAPAQPASRAAQPI
jgi:hypothetical protein